MVQFTLRQSDFLSPMDFVGIVNNGLSCPDCPRPCRSPCSVHLDFVCNIWKCGRRAPTRWRNGWESFPSRETTRSGPNRPGSVSSRHIVRWSAQSQRQIYTISNYPTTCLDLWSSVLDNNHLREQAERKVSGTHSAFVDRPIQATRRDSDRA